MAKHEIISIREFAKRIKVDESAVRKAIREKRMLKGYDPIKKTIDVLTAMKDEWVKEQLDIKPKAGISRAKAIAKMEEVQAGTPTEDDGEPTFKYNKNLTAREAMRRREIVRLALEQKELEEREGILVKKDKVNNTLFRYGNELKQELFNIPKRIARDVMCAPSEVEAINIINDELIRVLKTATFKL